MTPVSRLFLAQQPFHIRGYRCFQSRLSASLSTCSSPPTRQKLPPHHHPVAPLSSLLMLMLAITPCVLLPAGRTLVWFTWVSLLLLLTCIKRSYPTCLSPFYTRRRASAPWLRRLAPFPDIKSPWSWLVCPQTTNGYKLTQWARSRALLPICSSCPTNICSFPISREEDRTWTLYCCLKSW